MNQQWLQLPRFDLQDKILECCVQHSFSIVLELSSDALVLVHLFNTILEL